MEVTFVKRHGERDRVYVRREDGSVASWSFPSYGEGLPHDLAHLVVENGLGLTAGFWGLVGDGVDFSRVSREADRAATGVRTQGLAGRDLTELRVAESAVAGVASPFMPSGLSDADCVAEIRSQCRRMGVGVPASVTEERIRVVRARLREMGERWRALGTEGSLTVSFRPQQA